MIWTILYSHNVFDWSLIRVLYCIVIFLFFSSDHNKRKKKCKFLFLFCIDFPHFFLLFYECVFVSELNQRNVLYDKNNIYMRCSKLCSCMLLCCYCVWVCHRCSSRSIEQTYSHFKVEEDNHVSNFRLMTYTQYWTHSPCINSLYTMPPFGCTVYIYVF